MSTRAAESASPRGSRGRLSSGHIFSRDVAQCVTEIFQIKAKGIASSTIGPTFPPYDPSGSESVDSVVSVVDSRSQLRDQKSAASRLPRDGAAVKRISSPEESEVRRASAFSTDNNFFLSPLIFPLLVARDGEIPSRW